MFESELDQLGVLHHYLIEMEYPDEPTDLELWVGEWGKDGPSFSPLNIHGKVLGKFWRGSGWEFEIESDPYPQHGQVILVVEMGSEPWYYVLTEWPDDELELVFYWSLTFERHTFPDLEDKILQDLGYSYE